MKTIKLTECKKCGFPLEWKRDPAFLKNEIFSLLHYEDNVCETCGHQKDGYTISKIQKLLHRYRDAGIKQYKKEVINLIEIRMIDLEAMLDCDEDLMWKTSLINREQAIALFNELRKLKQKIEGEKLIK